jgi:hypothetical protein
LELLDKDQHKNMRDNKSREKREIKSRTLAVV